MKAKHLVTSLTLAAALATTAGAGITYAANTTNPADDPMQTLVTAIAEKFSLNESDVQAVFDEQRAVIEEQHETVFAEHIAQGVTAGDITQDQANAIQDKRTELESLRATLKDASEEDRRTAMKDAMDDLHQWALDNSIPEQYLPFGGPRGGRGPEFGHHFAGQRDGDSASTDEAATTTGDN